MHWCHHSAAPSTSSTSAFGSASHSSGVGAAWCDRLQVGGAPPGIPARCIGCLVFFPRVCRSCKKGQSLQSASVPDVGPDTGCGPFRRKKMKRKLSTQKPRGCGDSVSIQCATWQPSVRGIQFGQRTATFMDGIGGQQFV